MRSINAGDKVWIEWQGAKSLKGTVLHTPSDVGDLWYIKADTGKVIGVNPNCSLLISIAKQD